PQLDPLRFGPGLAGRWFRCRADEDSVDLPPRVRVPDEDFTVRGDTADRLPRALSQHAPVLIHRARVLGQVAGRQLDDAAEGVRIRAMAKSRRKRHTLHVTDQVAWRGHGVPRPGGFGVVVGIAHFPYTDGGDVEDGVSVEAESLCGTHHGAPERVASYHDPHRRVRSTNPLDLRPQLV